MRKQFLALLTAALVVSLSVGVGLSVAAGTASGGKGKADATAGQAHDLEGPYSKEQRERRAKALERQVKGKLKPGEKVAKVAQDKWVELEREGTDKIFVVIAEFGNERYPNALFQDTVGGNPASNAQRFDGPLHNEIPSPDRKVDNTTLWQADYAKPHYESMYFDRMAKYYEAQSSGRYSVDGDVTEWVKVPFNQALYGRDYCGGIVCSTTKALVRDALAVWVKGQLDSGKSLAEVTSYLQTFDEWDRYDSDADGNFDESDGFIDHFQIVHAGGDQAAGDPIYGTDAIWSHRWYANLQAGGPNGLVGVNAGSNGGLVSSSLVPNNPTGVWVGDYTIQPENGGLGVFAHEYGHDLGLPDLYDTSGNTGGAENSTGFWTLMSSGANIGNGGPKGIGDHPTDLGSWEKFQLGWLGGPASSQGTWYDVAFAGGTSEHQLGPSNQASSVGKQALFVVLPDKEVPLDLGDPYAGANFYYSGSGDELDNRMYRSFTLPAGSSLSAKVRYDIELDWDYAGVVVSTDGGATWTPVNTNLSTTTDPNGQNIGFGITGSSGGSWVDLTADLSAFTGNVLLGFRYWTDVAVAEPGIGIDDIQVTGAPLDGAETPAGWTFDPTDGFRVTTGDEIELFFNAYVAEFRSGRGYDRSLGTAYNFGFLNTKPDWVESFPYHEGLLISYWDSSQLDNNVGDHPGEGLILPIDAHPTFHHTYDGHLVRPRILTFDSAFSTDALKAITIHKDGNATTIPAQPAVPTFDDTLDWWFNADEHASTGSHVGRYQPGWVGVNVPKTGTTVTVKRGTGRSSALTVQVAPK